MKNNESDDQSSKITITLIIDENKSAKCSINLNEVSQKLLMSLSEQICKKLNLEPKIKNRLFVQLEKTISSIKEKKKINEEFNTRYYKQIDKLKERDKRNEEIKNEQIQKEISECTFTPQINEMSNLIYNKKFKNDKSRLYRLNKKDIVINSKIKEIIDKKQSNPEEVEDLAKISLNNKNQNQNLDENKNKILSSNDVKMNINLNLNQNNNNIEKANLNKKNSDMFKTLSIANNLNYTTNSIMNHNGKSFNLFDDNNNNRIKFDSREIKTPKNGASYAKRYEKKLISKGNFNYGKEIPELSSSLNNDFICEKIHHDAKSNISIREENFFKNPINIFKSKGEIGKHINKKLDLDKNILLNTDGPGERIQSNYSMNVLHNNNNLTKESNLLFTEQNKTNNNPLSKGTLSVIESDNKLNCGILEKKSSSRLSKFQIKENQSNEKVQSHRLNKSVKLNKLTKNSKRPCSMNKEEEKNKIKDKSNEKKINLCNKKALNLSESKDDFFNRLYMSKKLNSTKRAVSYFRSLYEYNNSTKEKSKNTIIYKDRENKNKKFMTNSLQNNSISSYGNKSLPIFQKNSSYTVTDRLNRISYYEKKKEDELNSKLMSRKREQLNTKMIYINESNKNLSKYLNNQIKNIYEILTSNMDKLNSDFINNLDLPSHIKKKVILPTCLMITNKNLEFNFENFQLIANEIINNYFK